MAQFTGQVKWFNTKVFDFVGDVVSTRFMSH